MPRTQDWISFGKFHSFWEPLLCRTDFRENASTITTTFYTLQVKSQPLFILHMLLFYTYILFLCVFKNLVLGEQWIKKYLWPSNYRPPVFPRHNSFIVPQTNLHLWISEIQMRFYDIVRIKRHWIISCRNIDCASQLAQVSGQRTQNLT